MKKVLIILNILVLLVLSLNWIFGLVIAGQAVLDSGGADGPTSVFIERDSIWELLTAFGIPIILLLNTIYLMKKDKTHLTEKKN